MHNETWLPEGMSRLCFTRSAFPLCRGERRENLFVRTRSGFHGHCFRSCSRSMWFSVLSVRTPCALTPRGEERTRTSRGTPEKGYLVYLLPCHAASLCHSGSSVKPVFLSSQRTRPVIPFPFHLASSSGLLLMVSDYSSTEKKTIVGSRNGSPCFTDRH